MISLQNVHHYWFSLFQSFNCVSPVFHFYQYQVLRFFLYATRSDLYNQLDKMSDETKNGSLGDCRCIFICYSLIY